MADIFTKKKRSEVMARIRAKNTTPEKTVFRALRAGGIYFRTHYKRAVGTPDIAIPKKKIAIFIDGDFWHGYRYPTWKHKMKPFWCAKIERNRARDKRTFAKLRREGWKVLRVWEHELAKKRVVRTIERLIASVRE